MLKEIKRFFKEEDGLGTVEIVVILAVLVSIALIFRTQIVEFVKDTLKKILGDTESKTTIQTS